MLVRNMKEFHSVVCRRDGYICQYCHKDFSYPCYFNEKGVNQFVCGHHTKTQGSSPETKLETDIGKCTCFGCHEKIHRGLIDS